MATNTHVLNLIINARTTVSEALNKAQGQLNEFITQQSRAADISEKAAERIDRSYEIIGRKRDLTDQIREVGRSFRELHANEQDFVDRLNRQIESASRNIERYKDIARKKAELGFDTSSADAQVKRFTTTLQNLRRQLDEGQLQFSGDRTDLRKQLDSLKDEKLKVQVEVEGDQAARLKIARLRNEARRNINIAIKADTDEDFNLAIEKLKSIQLEAERLGDRQLGERIKANFQNAFFELSRSQKDIVQQKFDIDFKPSLFQRIRLLRNELRTGSRDSESLIERFGAMSREAGNLSRSFDRAQLRMSRLASAARGFIIVAVLKFVEAFVTSLDALAGSFIAVASSAGQAALAVGGTFVAGLSQALPVLGLFGATLFRLQDVFQALDARQKLQEQRATQATTAIERQRDATEKITTANESLADADRRVQDATEGVTRARKEAGRELEDIIAKERQARLEHLASILAFENSQRTLKASIRSGDVGGTAEAQIDVSQRGLAVEESARGATRATEDAREARREGVEGSDRFKQAVRQLEDARRAARNARSALAEARREASTTATQGVTAARQLEFLLGRLSGAENRLYRVIARIQDRFREAVRPITDIIVNAISRALRRVDDLLDNQAVIRAFTRLAGAMAASIDEISRALTSDENIRIWVEIIKEASRNIGPLTDIFIKLSKIFLDIAQAAAPALRDIIFFIDSIVEKFGLMTDESQRAKDGLQPLSDFFREGVQHLFSWINLALAILNLFAALSGAGGAQSGKTAIEDLTDTINGAADSVRKNSEEVGKFFQDSIRVLSVIGTLIVAVGDAMLEAFDPSSVDAFANIFEDIVIPVLINVIRFLGFIAKTINAVFEAPVVGPFLEQVVVLTLTASALASIFFTLATVMAPVIILIRRFMLLMIFMPEILAKAATALRGVAAAILIVGRALTLALLSNPLIAAIAVIVAALIFLQLKFNIFGKAIQFIKDNADDVLKFLKEHWVDALLILFTGPFGPIIVAFRNFGPQITRALRSALGFVGEFLEGVWNNRLIRLIFTPFRIAIAQVRGLGEGLVNAFRRVFRALREFFENPSWSSLRTLLLSPFRGIADVVKGIFERLKDAITGVLKDIKKTIEDILVKIPDAFLPGPLEKLKKNIQGDRFREEILKQTEDSPFQRAKPGSRAESELQAKAEADLRKQAEAFKKKKEAQREAREEDEKASKSSKRHGDQADDTGKKVDRSNKKLRDVRGAGRAAGRGYTSAARSAGQAGLAVVRAMQIIASSTNSVLEEFGAKTIKFAVRNPQSILEGIRLGVDAIDGFAEGGMIPGFGLFDTVPLIHGMAAPGEAILTRHQQDWVNHALANTFGISLDELFRKEARPHYMAKGGPIKKFQQGGVTGGPGDSGEGFVPVWNLARDKFKMKYFTGFEGHDKYTQSGNISDHFRHLALDMGNGILTPQEDALNAFWKNRLTRTVKQLIWRDKDQFNGYNIGGHKDHIHLALKPAFAFNKSLMARLLNRASRGLNITQLLRGIDESGGGEEIPNIPNLRILGRNGALKNIIRRASRRTVRAANRYLDEKSGDMSLAPQTGTPAKVVPGILGIARRAAEMADVRFNERIVRTLLGKESTGGKNYGPSGPLSATGPFQVIPSTFLANRHPRFPNITNPLHNAIAAMRYIKGRYGSLQNMAATTGLFGGGYKGYAKGGFIGNSKRALSRFQSGGILSSSPSIKRIQTRLSSPEINFEDELELILDVLIAFGKGIKRNANETKKKFEQRSKAVDNIIKSALISLTSDEGPLSALKADNERIVAGMASFLKRISIRMNKAGVAFNKLNPEQILEGELQNLDKARLLLLGERSVVLQSLRSARRALRRADTPGERQRAESAVVNLKGRLTEIDDAVANNLEERLNKQTEQANAIIEEITTQSDRRIARSGLRSRLAELRGDTGTVLAENDARNTELLNRRAALQAQVARVQKLDPKVADALRDQIADIDVQIAEGIDARFRTELDAITAGAERRMSLSNVRSKVAEFFGDTATQIAEANARVQDIRERRQQLIELVNRAQGAGQGRLADDLRAQIVELEGQILDGIVARLQVQIDAVNNAAQRRLSLVDVQSRIAEISGPGFTANRGRQIELANQRTSILQEQRGGLEQLLKQANLDQNRKAIDDLTLQLAENELAILENSKRIAELNGELGGPQQFTTTSWRIFREAIFDGLGGILPQFKMESLSGNLINNELLNVPSSQQIGSSNAQEISINLTSPTEVLDPEWLANRIAWEMKTSK